MNLKTPDITFEITNHHWRIGKLLQGGRTVLQYCSGDSSMGKRIDWSRVAWATLEKIPLLDTSPKNIEFLVCANKKKLREIFEERLKFLRQVFTYFSKKNNILCLMEKTLLKDNVDMLWKILKDISKYKCQCILFKC